MTIGDVVHKMGGDTRRISTFGVGAPGMLRSQSAPMGDHGYEAADKELEEKSSSGRQDGLGAIAESSESRSTRAADDAGHDGQ